MKRARLTALCLLALVACNAILGNDPFSVGASNDAGGTDGGRRG